MIIFEDLYWIDFETQALLNLLVDAIANARILLLVNYRPEYRREWGSRTHYTQLRLDPLASEIAEEMLSALLGEQKDLTSLKRLIIERTDGTPFFMEEMVQSLLEEGVLKAQWDGNGRPVYRRDKGAGYRSGRAGLTHRPPGSGGEGVAANACGAGT
jgi:predicted ATPase